MKIFYFLILIIGLLQNGGSPEFSQWRGPERNGIYKEKGLMKSWPVNGPAMQWVFEGLGYGHGSVATGKNKLFVLGMSQGEGFLYILDYNGKLVRKVMYGPEWDENYTGTRSTPTIVNGLVYFESGRGTVYCYDGNSGNKIWSADLLKEYDAKNITWGMAESLLIKGDTLYCTPGGKQNNIVALNRFSGKLIWSSPGNHQPSAYCSPAYVKHNKTELIVTMTASSIIGVDARTGKFYWQVPQFQDNKIHANTPVYYNGMIYCASQYADENSGLAALKLSDDGKSVTLKWRNEGFMNLMGGIIVLDGYIYGSQYQRNSWCCIDASSGQIMYTDKTFGDGNIIMADGMFYCYSERGEAALVSASPLSFNVLGRFPVKLGTETHWAHPVIHNGRLYLRHGNALIAYDIRAKY